MIKLVLTKQNIWIKLMNYQLINFMTTFTLDRFQGYFFDVSVLLVSKRKFHHSSSSMISEHDLTSNCWMIQDFNIFWHYSTVCLNKHQQIVNHSAIWHSIMFIDHIWRWMVKISLWSKQYLNIEKGDLENYLVWKSS